MKRHIYFLTTLIIICFGFLIGCTSNQEEPAVQYITLPDLTGMSKAEIEEELSELGINHYFVFSFKICYDESYYDKFVEYSGGKQIGDKIKSTDTVTVSITPLHLNVNNLDKVSLEADYVGKSFIDDGIGEVVLDYAVDGDTARFRDAYSDTVTGSFSVRFLGIDTPESTREIEAWGKAAAAFTKEKLNNAKHIVLEAEGARTETYGRYLAFVWIDGKLLNLEIVQEAYSSSTLSSKSKYFQVMVETMMQAKKTGRRVYGERDRNFNYK